MPQTKFRALIVEDESVLARAVGQRLERDGYRCEIASSLTEARKCLKDTAGSPDLMLLDMRLPDGSGLELLTDDVPGVNPEQMATIVMTAFGDVENAVAAMKAGASDYLRKPVDLEELAFASARAIEAVRIKNQLAYSREREAHHGELPRLTGKSPPIEAVQKRLHAIANLIGDGSAPPPTVLILGETGTGKGEAARIIHQSGPRADRPFVHIDCASLPTELIEAELFGHARGAYTGASGERSGLIEAAEDGSLFLDEIGELPVALQTKLLNVIERRVVRRIGATRENPVAARFIAATNRNLQDMVADGRFRSDLYYRLNVLTIEMPALYSCTGDAVLLAEHFATQVARRFGRSIAGFTAEARVQISRYHWPGNVRELKHTVERAVLLSDANQISASALALPTDTESQSPAPTFEDSLEAMTLDQAERWLIEKALLETRGNVTKAAERLGVTRMAMRYRIEKHRLGSRAEKMKNG